MDKKKYIEVL